MEEIPFPVGQGTIPARLADQQVAIIGLGLMGGSLALALRGKCALLLGVDPDPAVCRLAVQRGVVDRVAEDPAEVLPEATLVVLAAPVSAILSLLADLPHWHSGRAAVVDLGSTKLAITSAMQALPERLEPVGGHPMCGKESSSLAQAQADLFQGAAFVLTALPNSTPVALKLATELVEAVGARPLWLDPETHDRWVAATSHLPYLLANALASTIPQEAAPLAGSGFRSAARLAPSSLRMMLDILSTNQANVLSSVRRFREQLEAVEYALATNDFIALQGLLEQGARRYEEILAQDRSESNSEQS
jgi:prephenate dehydrogenase